MDTKYVTLQHRVETGELVECAIIFSGELKHNQFDHLYKARLLGAGFVNIVANGVYCWGDSETLKLKSRQEDNLIVGKALGFNRVEE